MDLHILWTWLIATQAPSPRLHAPWSHTRTIQDSWGQTNRREHYQSFVRTPPTSPTHATAAHLNLCVPGCIQVDNYSWRLVGAFWPCPSTRTGWPGSKSNRQRPWQQLQLLRPLQLRRNRRRGPNTRRRKRRRETEKRKRNNDSSDIDTGGPVCVGASSSLPPHTSDGLHVWYVKVHL